jgi:hypothetical protein
MATKLIELSDGLLVEVQADEEAVQQIAAGSADRVKRALDGARVLLKNDGQRHHSIQIAQYPE